MSIQIKPDENSVLIFEVDIKGSNSIPIPRLVVPISDNGISLVFEGKMSDGSVEVDISELVDLTSTKVFEGKLEVVIEDSIFYPWEDTIEIIEETKVEAKNINLVSESKITVTAKGKETKVEKKIVVIEKKKLGTMFNDKL